MGMPGSETALEELMCRVLGDLLQDGIVAKLADDLYCGGNTPEELIRNWRRVLDALARCNLRLAASKTIVCPQSTTILGWMWSQGSIRASSHRVATLATCSRPSTIREFRGFIGAYKVLARVLKGYARYLAPMEQALVGKQSRESFVWSDSLIDTFLCAQRALSSCKEIALPRPSDQLWIVTDGSVKQSGIGAA